MKNQPPLTTLSHPLIGGWDSSWFLRANEESTLNHPSPPILNHQLALSGALASDLEASRAFWAPRTRTRDTESIFRLGLWLDESISKDSEVVHGKWCHVPSNRRGGRLFFRRPKSRLEREVDAAHYRSVLLAEPSELVPFGSGVPRYGLPRARESRSTFWRGDLRGVGILQETRTPLETVVALTCGSRAPESSSGFPFKGREL